MAANRKTLDTDIIYLREIYARTGMNQVIAYNKILTANGDGSTRWDFVNPSTFNGFYGNTGPVVYADGNLSTLHISTTGPPGLLTSYADPVSKSLILEQHPPVIGVSQRAAPGVLQAVARNPPLPIVNIQNYSTINLIGVRDVLLSTVVDISASPAIFISISSFTSQGYSSISGEAFAWRPYVYNVLSTAQGLPSFVSTIPTTWATGLQNLSTAEVYPNYSTGDVYFSTVSINMSDYIGYVNPGVTSMILEVEPTYVFSRFILGNDLFPSLMKNISSYIQYSNATSSVILSGSENTDMILSQQSNVYTSNYFNKPMKLPIDSATVAANWATDGPSGYYTLFHRIPGGMAELVAGTACDYAIGPRGGMSNATPSYVNATSVQNGAFMHIYNTMPFPAPFQESLFMLHPDSLVAGPGAAINIQVSEITTTAFRINWNGSAGATSFIYEISYDGKTTTLAHDTVPPYFTTFADLAPNTTYTVVVHSLNVHGSTASSPVSVTTLGTTNPGPQKKVTVRA